MQGPPVLSACVHANLTKTRATVGVSGALAHSGEVTPARRVFLWPLFQRRGSGLTCAEGSPNGRDSTVSTHPAPDSDTQRCSLSLSVSISLSPWQRFSAALSASLCSAPSLQQVSLPEGDLSVVRPFVFGRGFGAGIPEVGVGT